MLQQSTQQDVIFILFGATGDLAQKKIIPALSQLCEANVFSDNSRIITVSRRDWDSSQFVEFAQRSVSQKLSPALVSKVSYTKVDIDAGVGYGELADLVSRYTKNMPDTQVVMYLSLAPHYHASVIEQLSRANLLIRSKTKLLIEKPFGTDGGTARSLNTLLESYLDENDIYRIDHYLSKGAAQNIMNGVCSQKTISSITARLCEQKGIDGRGESYDPVGAFRDVGQNHMLEMAALALAAKTTGDWQKARAEALIKLVPPKNTCADFRRGQYEGYHAEKGVAQGSQTETAFKVVTYAQGTHVELIGGKQMSKNEVSLTITYTDGSSDYFDFSTGPDAYQTMIRAGLAGSRREFVGKEEAFALWSYADRARECWSEVPLEIYSKERPFLIE